jgi:hypothetical protein
MNELQQARGLIDAIHSAGGPAVQHREEFAQIEQHVETLEAGQLDGIFLGGLMLASFVGILWTMWGAAQEANKTAKEVVKTGGRIAKLAMWAAAIWFGGKLLRSSR